MLAEIPPAWRKAVNRWARLNRRHRREVDGQPAPSRNDEYLFYQTLLGVWPLEPPHGKELAGLSARVAAYTEKATHEAKLHTSWINPHAEYDAAVRAFVTAALDEQPKNRFLADVRQFHEQIVAWGLYTALSQLFLKLTAPGVPDIYQGQELWDFSLVDPDNRRPVDFALRRKMLARLGKDAGRNDRSLLALARQLVQDPRDPRLKLFVTWRALQFRRRHAGLFRLGDYIPLAVSGPQARHVCAFARTCPSAAGAGPELAIVIAPRLIAALTPPQGESAAVPPPLGSAVWDDTHVLLENLPATAKRTSLRARSHRLRMAAFRWQPPSPISRSPCWRGPEAPRKRRFAGKSSRSDAVMVAVVFQPTVYLRPRKVSSSSFACRPPSDQGLGRLCVEEDPRAAGCGLLQNPRLSTCQVPASPASSSIL